MLEYSDTISERLSLPDTKSPYPDTKSYSDANNNSDTNKLSTMRGDKYSLRPRSLRTEDDTENNFISKKTPSPTNSKSRNSKPKQKPAPLSKYRRKTANARERSRMREINAAFEALRRAVPQMTSSGSSCYSGNVIINANEKLTKITTLRLAMRYISSLSAALQNSDGGSAVMIHHHHHHHQVYQQQSGEELVGDLLSDCSDLDCFLLESDGESLALSDNSFTLSEQSLTPIDFQEQSLTPTLFNDSGPDNNVSIFDHYLTNFN